MKGYEVVVAFLQHEGAEGEAEGEVVEGVGFFGRERGEDGCWNGDFEGWWHGCLFL